MYSYVVDSGIWNTKLISVLIKFSVSLYLRIYLLCKDTTDTQFRITHNPNDFTHTTPELQSHVYI